MQIRINTADDAYRNARREDLIQLLDGLGAESRRLESEIAELEQTRIELQSGADTQRVAREEAEQPDQGAVHPGRHRPRGGPGDPDADRRPAGQGRRRRAAGRRRGDARRRGGGDRGERHHPGRRVDLVRRGRQGLVIDGKPVRRPITIEVIGDPHSLEEAARFRGGIVSEITGPKIGGEVQIDQVDRLVVESLHAAARESVRSARIAHPRPRVDRRSLDQPGARRAGLPRRPQVLRRPRVGPQRQREHRARRHHRVRRRPAGRHRLRLAADGGRHRRRR